MAIPRIPDEATGAQQIAAAGIYQKILKPNGFGLWAMMEGELLHIGAGQGPGINIGKDGRVS